MTGAGEDEAAPPPLNQQPMEEAAASKLRRLDHHHGDGDAPRSPPSFRMEDLPAEIQSGVMSLLPLKDAVRTSIVSRSWRMLWRFHCNLCFDGPNDRHYSLAKLFDDDYEDCSYACFPCPIKTKRAKFIEAVNWVIQRHSGIGINKFSIRCFLDKEYFDHVDRWVGFAASSKAKIIDFDLKEIGCTSREVHHFPLEALNAQGNSFVHSLFLANVLVKPHSGIYGFTMLRRLVLQSVQIFGDFPGLLAKCSALEDLEIIECRGMANLIIPHKLDKLQRLRIAGLKVQMVEFHVDDLAHFEYKGRLIPIVLHGCSKLEKAAIVIYESGLGHAFTAVPSILPVKILNVQAYIWKYSQLQKLTTRPEGMFMNLRHMTCHITIDLPDSLSENGILQLAHCLDLAPQLETLRLDMRYLGSEGSSGEVTVEEGHHMRRHDHLKKVYMSGFRCCKSQVQIACCILKNASVLEHVTIETRTVDEVLGECSTRNTCAERRFLPEIRKWAQLASQRFGKVITVLDVPSE